MLRAASYTSKGFLGHFTNAWSIWSVCSGRSYLHLAHISETYGMGFALQKFAVSGR